MSAHRLFYNLLLYLAAPLLLLRLLWRARRQSAYLHHVAERLGIYDGPEPEGPWIWVHAVSVGETRAAEPLIRALQQQRPLQRILLTHMTPTGRDAGLTLFGDRVTRCYLPYDYPGAVARFLDRYRPVAGVLMETEIWPNLIHAAMRRGIPLYLVNARLSERSQRGYQRSGALARDAMRGLTKIAAQTENDATRLRSLGAERVVVTGNLKFDLEWPAQQIEQGQALRQSIGARTVLLAASTREGEETLLLDAVMQAEIGDALLVIVPRHPQRFDEVAALIAARGLQLQRRSAGTPITAGTRVVLGDSMGEMFMYYAACDVVLMGGSFLPYGAHSLIEPCALGRPVIIGPSTYNFAEAADAAIAAGAALRVSDLAEAVPLALLLAADAGRCQRMGAAGAAFTAAHRGATRRVMDLMGIPVES